METLDNQMLIKEIFELAQNTKDKIEITLIEFKNYLECLNYEKFEEKENETEEEAIKRAESIYDRLDEVVRRNKIVVINGKKIINSIEDAKLKIEKIIRECENDQIVLTKHNDELINKIIELEERKLNKEIETFNKQKQELEQKIEIRKELFNNKKKEWKQQIISFEEMEEWKQQIINQIISFEEMKQLEEWSGMKIGKIIFDSNVDNWNVGTSVFDQKILNKSDLLFVIDDNNGNKFGGYINSKINNYGWVNDPKSFLFSLRSNGRLNGMFKFEIKDSQHAFELFDQKHSSLFAFGFGNNYSFLNECSQDITILKQKTKIT